MVEFIENIVIIWFTISDCSFFDCPLCYHNKTVTMKWWISIFLTLRSPCLPDSAPFAVSTVHPSAFIMEIAICSSFHVIMSIVHSMLLCYQRQVEPMFRFNLRVLLRCYCFLCCFWWSLFWEEMFCVGVRMHLRGLLTLPFLFLNSKVNASGIKSLYFI